MQTTITSDTMRFELKGKGGWYPLRLTENGTDKVKSHW